MFHIIDHILRSVLLPINSSSAKHVFEKNQIFKILFFLNYKNVIKCSTFCHNVQHSYLLIKTLFYFQTRRSEETFSKVETCHSCSTHSPPPSHKLFYCCIFFYLRKWMAKIWLAWIIAARCVGLSRQSNLAIGPLSTHADIYEVLRIGRVFSTVEGIVQLVAVTVSPTDNELHASVVRVDTATFISIASAVHSILLNSQPGGRNLRTIDHPSLT